MTAEASGDRDGPTVLARDQIADALARGLCRALSERGFASLTEVTLNSGRRVDVIGLDAKGRIVIVEINSSPEDFKSDRKWPDYLTYCDSFYFAVPNDFPLELIPADLGLIVADAYGAEVLRESPAYTLNGTRRRAILPACAAG